MSEQVWVDVCAFDALLPNTGVCALVNQEQVAIFRVEDELYAISNYDPIGDANVLSRGIIGSVGERKVVASPLYKEHYDLVTGECLEQPSVTLKTYPVRHSNRRIELRTS